MNEEFAAKADSAERYLREVKGKVKANHSYEFIYDATLAEFCVYNWLCERTFVGREAFLRSLQEWLTAPAPVLNEAFDQERFARFYGNMIQGLVDKYQRADLTRHLRGASNSL